MKSTTEIPTQRAASLFSLDASHLLTPRIARAAAAAVADSGSSNSLQTLESQYNNDLDTIADLSRQVENLNTARDENAARIAAGLDLEPLHFTQELCALANDAAEAETRFGGVFGEAFRPWLIQGDANGAEGNVEPGLGEAAREARLAFEDMKSLEAFVKFRQGLNRVNSQIIEESADIKNAVNMLKV